MTAKELISKLSILDGETEIIIKSISAVTEYYPLTKVEDNPEPVIIGYQCNEKEIMAIIIE